MQKYLIALLLVLSLSSVSALTVIEDLAQGGIDTDGNVTSNWFFGKLNWSYLQGVPASASYTHLSNFTDNILWTTLFNSTFSNLGVNLGFNSTYNETYALTSADVTANRSEWFSTFNSTYDSKISYNTTFNQSLTDTLYAGIEWDYNQTTASINLADLKFLNLSGTNANQNINISPFNLTADWLFAKLNWSNVQNAPAFLTSYTETDPIFLAENASLWAEARNKYNSTYNNMLNQTNTTGNQFIYTIQPNGTALFATASGSGADGTGGWTNTSTTTSTNNLDVVMTGTDIGVNMTWERGNGSLIINGGDNPNVPYSFNIRGQTGTNYMAICADNQTDYCTYFGVEGSTAFTLYNYIGALASSGNYQIRFIGGYGATNLLILDRQGGSTIYTNLSLGTAGSNYLFLRAANNWVSSPAVGVAELDGNTRVQLATAGTVRMNVTSSLLTSNVPIRGTNITLTTVPTGATGADTDYLCINTTSGEVFRNETGC